MGSIRYARATDLARRYEDEFDDIDELFERPAARQPRRKRAQRPQSKHRALRRDEVSKPFKCRRCKAFVGMPLTGGRHRNHCPSCLYSLHVDEKRPGDRRSDCRSLMQPIGTAFKPDGEQTVVHRCLGCGIERYNRVAADDSPLLLMQLPVIQLPGSAEERPAAEDQEIA